MRIDRRTFLGGVVAGGASLWLPKVSWSATPQAAPKPRMVRFPEKADLLLLTDQPPQLETPISWFKHDLTPNEAFFVRWHLSGIPTSVDLRTFRLAVGGHVKSPQSLSVDQLKKSF